jgi:hypothetical protein
MWRRPRELEEFLGTIGWWVVFGRFWRKGVRAQVWARESLKVGAEDSSVCGRQGGGGPWDRVAGPARGVVGPTSSAASKRQETSVTHETNGSVESRPPKTATHTRRTTEWPKTGQKLKVLDIRRSAIGEFFKTGQQRKCWRRLCGRDRRSGNGRVESVGRLTGAGQQMAPCTVCNAAISKLCLGVLDGDWLRGGSVGVVTGAENRDLFWDAACGRRAVDRSKQRRQRLSEVTRGLGFLPPTMRPAAALSTLLRPASYTSGQLGGLASKNRAA